ncbi:hypothetical protein [Mesorhizobium argentiipisi]|uniref:Uncharacterized protein n=1 Tax=Mesorhizobium argentiipisi TaxID=3015175 RepID=A0ABU8KAW1_9HYPH
MQKGGEAHWGGKAPQVDIAIPALGYQNHVLMDRRKWLATDASAYA